jgi:hypothetical protein
MRAFAPPPSLTLADVPVPVSTLVPPASDAGGVDRCHPRRRAAQAVFTLAVAVLLGFGAVVGDDHWYPVGPFRMFSTATPPDGYVSAMSLEVRVGDQTWERTALSPRNVGLNRAEVEGRVPQIVADPTLLRDLADAHARMHPADERWTGVRVIRNRTLIIDSRPTGTVETEIVSTWTAR